MAKLDHDLDLKLDDAHCTAILDARIKERTAQIRRNDAKRKLARKLAGLPAPAQDSPGVLALVAKVSEEAANAATHASAQAAARAVAKAAHNVTAEPAEEEYHPTLGVLRLKAAPTVLVQGKPSVEYKRKVLTDKQADDNAASYVLACEASDRAFDLMRQIEDYQVAHPELLGGSPGEPPPVDPAYEALKAALTAQQDIIVAEQAKQGAIWQAVLAGEPPAWHARMDIATGEIVLGRKPDEG